MVRHHMQFVVYVCMCVLAVENHMQFVLVTPFHEHGHGRVHTGTYRLQLITFANPNLLNVLLMYIT